MAIIRTAAPLGAALIALTAIVPGASQAQAPGAPLQLVPGPGQAKPATRATAPRVNAARPVAKAPGKAASNPAVRSSPRQNMAATQPAPKVTRPNSRAAANPIASKRQNQIARNTQRARIAASAQITRTAVVPYLTATRPVLRRGTQEPPIMARGSNTDTHRDHVMRGRDSISLIAMLPWWRNDRMQTVTYGSAEAESKVLEAAAAWLASNGGASEAETIAGEPVLPSAGEPAEVADADTPNDIDQTAETHPAAPTPTFLQTLLALIGGAAAAAAVSARLLFA